MADKRADYEYNMAIANDKYLKEKYGGSSASWKSTTRATLIGADFADSYANWATSNLQAEAIESRQNEISARADMSVASILAKGEAVQGVQQAAFSRAGVKLEGSAINVLQQTSMEATEAATLRQRQADFQNAQMAVQKRMMEVESEFAPLEFLASAGRSYASIDSTPSSSKPKAASRSVAGGFNLNDYM